MDFTAIIEAAKGGNQPMIHVINERNLNCHHLGVFGSSYNPVTTAHLELMRLAAEQFKLDRMLALAGIANADKTSYDCPLEVRLQMLRLATQDYSLYEIGLSSHPYFVDQLDALQTVYPDETEFCFIVGLDTFERIVDRDDKYTRFYHRKFTDRSDSLEYLMNRSSLIVASRAGEGLSEVQALTKLLPDAVRDKVFYLEFPADLGEQSASEVRRKMRDGESVKGLVHPAVERFIDEHRLYR